MLGSWPEARGERGLGFSVVKNGLPSVESESLASQSMIEQRLSAPNCLFLSFARRDRGDDGLKPYPFSCSGHEPVACCETNAGTISVKALT